MTRPHSSAYFWEVIKDLATPKPTGPLAPTQPLKPLEEPKTRNPQTLAQDPLNPEPDIRHGSLVTTPKTDGGPKTP